MKINAILQRLMFRLFCVDVEAEAANLRHLLIQEKFSTWIHTEVVAMLMSDQYLCSRTWSMEIRWVNMYAQSGLSTIETRSNLGSKITSINEN